MTLGTGSPPAHTAPTPAPCFRVPAQAQMPARSSASQLASTPAQAAASTRARRAAKVAVRLRARPRAWAAERVRRCVGAGSRRCVYRSPHACTRTGSVGIRCTAASSARTRAVFRARALAARDGPQPVKARRPSQATTARSCCWSPPTGAAARAGESRAGRTTSRETAAAMVAAKAAALQDLQWAEARPHQVVQHAASAGATRVECTWRRLWTAEPSASGPG
jgi:hypothetical protein